MSCIVSGPRFSFWYLLSSLSFQDPLGPLQDNQLQSKSRLPACFKILIALWQDPSICQHFSLLLFTIYAVPERQNLRIVKRFPFLSINTRSGFLTRLSDPIVERNPRQCYASYFPGHILVGASIICDHSL